MIKQRTPLSAACALLCAAAMFLPARAQAAQPAPLAQAVDPAAPAAPAAYYPLAAAGIALEGPNLIDGDLRGAQSARAADFNGDGALDIVAAARDDGRVLWYRSDGGAQPAFTAQPVGKVSGAYLALPADLNQDGKLDILVVAVGNVDPSAAAWGGEPAAAAGSGQIVWFQNDGQPSPGFTPHTLASGLNYPVAAVVADLDQDGRPDVAVAARDDSTLRWYANGGGATPTFGARQVITGLDGAVSVAVGDMDRDGDPDLISASENDDRIVWHANNGAGVFSPNVVRSGAPQPDKDFAKSVYAADMEGDGDLDIAYASEGGNEIGWYVSNGARPPQFAQVALTQEANHAKVVTVADLDRNGAPDILWAASGDTGNGILGRIGWLRSSAVPGSAAQPGFAPLVIQPEAKGGRDVAAADLDGDGDLDVLTAARESGQVVWFRNRTIHRNALYPAADVRVVGVAKSSRHVAAGDLDGDGDLDLVAVAQDDLTWFESNGGAPPAFTPHAIQTEQYQGRWVDIADMNGDGAPDILVASHDNRRILYYQNNGARPPAFTESVMSTQTLGPRAVLTADLDMDGDLDAYSAAGDNHRVDWIENDGANQPTFTTHNIDSGSRTDPVLAFPRSVYAADMDADGDLDMVAAAQGSDNVLIYENKRGAPLQWERRVVGKARGVQHVHAADMDGDGDMDIVLAAEGLPGGGVQNLVKVLLNADGKGRTFTEVIVDPTANSPHAVVPGDADGDGDQDIFAAVEVDNQLVWYESNGQSPPAFSKHLIYDQAFEAHGVNVADLDGDGDLDALGASRATGAVVWAENLGGQYRFAEAGFGATTLAAGGSAAVLAVSTAHLGRAADLPLQLAALDVRFEDGAGKRLSAAQVAARVQTLGVYLESNGNGHFDPGDRLLNRRSDMAQAANGRMLVPLTGASPAATAAPGGGALLYAVAELTAACGAQPLRLVALPTAPTAVDELAGDPLLAEGIRSLSGAEQVAPLDPPKDLRINEISANTSPDDDWLELYNAGAYAVDLGGMFLSDSVTNPTKHQIPAGITIPPGGYLVFIADETPGPLHLNFGLSASGETVVLSDVAARQQRVLDLITYGAQNDNQTSGRNPDGSTTWADLRAPSMGYANVRAGLTQPAYLPVVKKSAGC